MTPQHLKKVYFLLAVAITVAVAAFAVMSCQAPADLSVSGRPLTEFVTADFSGSGTCAECHSQLVDQAGNDVSMDSHWRSTMMANAARDPYFQAKVSAEVAQLPGLKETIEDKCSVCHMHMAFLQAQVDGSPAALLPPGFASASNRLHQAAMDGVSCNVCHQVEDQGLGTPQTFSGNFVIDTSTNPPERRSYGPFPDQFELIMREMAGFTPLLGEQTLRGELCATCHTLYTPYVDASGQIAGEFPEQTPYLEWQHSAYGSSANPQHCQSCHMPVAVGALPISNTPRRPAIPARQPFAQHYFVGGNAVMIRLLQANVEELGLTCSTTLLEATLQRTLEQLQNSAVGLYLDDAQTSGDTLILTLAVENEAGHKFPAGFPSRRAWLHVTVQDAQGQVVFESGQPRPDGSIVGCDADQDVSKYETHYDVLTSPDQVQVYESVLQDTEKQVTYTLLKAAGYVKDNRLVPRGFDKATAAADIAVHGAAAQDANFDQGEDVITYQISTQGHSGPFAVTAELLYQSISYRFVSHFHDYDTPEVTAFMKYYEAADKMPSVAASVKETVQ